MKCPYCNKMKYIPIVVYANVENYGPQVVRFKCNHCEKVIKAYGIRIVDFLNIEKTNENSDW